jgi:hypothetical protein
MIVATAHAVGWGQKLGAFGFGALIGWYVYFVNRYRTDTIQLTDVATLLGAIGGAAVLTLFPAKTTLFAAYGVGLAAGFFGYFVTLLIMVSKSPYYDVNWFLGGSHKKLPVEYVAADDRPQRPMGQHAGGA